MIDRKPLILDVASELLQTRSYTAFSYQDLSDRLGITKASIHHHFPSKQELLLALVDRFAQRQRCRLEEFDAEHARPWERLEAYFSLMAMIAQTGNKVCPAVSLESEYNVIPEAVRSRLHEVFEVRKRWLGCVLSEGRASGVMHFEGPAEERALMIMAAMKGGLLIARAEGPKAFTAIARQIRSNLKPTHRNGANDTVGSHTSRNENVQAMD